VSIRLRVFYKGVHLLEEKDAEVKREMESAGGIFVGSGYGFFNAKRDIEYDVPDTLASSVASKLIAKGYEIDCP
jgi:hypothetical protein